MYNVVHYWHITYTNRKPEAMCVYMHNQRDSILEYYRQNVNAEQSLCSYNPSLMENLCDCFVPMFITPMSYRKLPFKRFIIILSNHKNQKLNFVVKKIYKST